MHHLVKIRAVLYKIKESGEDLALQPLISSTHNTIITTTISHSAHSPRRPDLLFRGLTLFIHFMRASLESYRPRADPLTPLSPNLSWAYALYSLHESLIDIRQMKS